MNDDKNNTDELHLIDKESIIKMAVQYVAKILAPILFGVICDDSYYAHADKVLGVYDLQQIIFCIILFIITFFIGYKHYLPEILTKMRKIYCYIYYQLHKKDKE
jgi:hypothetical protein